MPDAHYVDLSNRGVIALEGADTRELLQGLISNDVHKISGETSIYAALLTPQGKFLHDFFLTALGDRLLLDCEAERRQDLLRRLMMYRLRAKVDIADVTGKFAVAAAIGDGALAALGLGTNRGESRDLDGGRIFVDPRVAGLGARAIVPQDRLDAVLQAAGLTRGDEGAYEQLRLTLGVPDGSRDILVEKSFLLECNFEELNGVDFDKGCYIGQELTARTKHRGTVRKRMFRVEADGPLPAPGSSIMLGEREAGQMLSGAGSTGLAMLRLEVVEAAAEAKQPLIAEQAKLIPVKPDWAGF